MSAAPATEPMRQAVPLQVRSVGRPTALSSLARLLLEMHARPALRVVPATDAKEAR